MKALIVYDSVYGSTEKIARSIGDAIACNVKVFRVTEINPSELGAIDFLIVGSPTQGGRPTPAIQIFLDKIAEPAIKDIKVAAFDTRISMKFAAIFGYAAERIARSLKVRGGILVVPPEGFFVMGREGVLKEGELERAAAWAKGILEGMQ
jgi:flavodoxin I